MPERRFKLFFYKLLSGDKNKIKHSNSAESKNPLDRAPFWEFYHQKENSRHGYHEGNQQTKLATFVESGQTTTFHIHKLFMGFPHYPMIGNRNRRNGAQRRNNYPKSYRRQTRLNTGNEKKKANKAETFD